MKEGLDDPLSSPGTPGISPAASMALGAPSSEVDVAIIESSAVESIDAIIRTLYASIYPQLDDDGHGVTGDGLSRPNWGRFRALFDPHARLTRVASDHSRVMAVEDFVQAVERNPQRALRECELARRTDTYAGIAHVFSSYSRVDQNGTHIRGINTIQLRNDGRRWWIVSLMWADESADEPLPSRYLPRH